jgi:hypothetical protein
MRQDHWVEASRSPMLSGGVPVIWLAGPDVWEIRIE